VLFAIAVYAFVLEIVDSYRWAGLAGFGILILSVIIWGIVYDKFFGL